MIDRIADVVVERGLRGLDRLSWLPMVTCQGVKNTSYFCLALFCIVSLAPFALLDWVYDLYTRRR